MYKYVLCTFPAFISHLLPLLHPSTLPPNFCFGRGILWCYASSTQAAEHCSNIWVQMQPSWLSLEHGVPIILIGCLYQALAFRQAALCASCASLHLVSGGFFKTDRRGGGADSHIREAWGFPYHQRQTLAQASHYPELLTGRDQTPLVHRFGG